MKARGLHLMSWKPQLFYFILNEWGIWPLLAGQPYIQWWTGSISIGCQKTKIISLKILSNIYGSWLLQGPQAHRVSLHHGQPVIAYIYNRYRSLPISQLILAVLWHIMSCQHIYSWLLCAISSSSSSSTFYLQWSSANIHQVFLSSAISCSCPYILILSLFI